MLDNYKQTFQDEARELLVELESALLELNENRGDVGVVGRAFRALHTIKGSGAMFGFDNIARFVHNLETAFDLLRQDKLAATSELINLTLSASDQIKAMLDEAAGNGTVDQERSAKILAELSKLVGLPGNEALQTAGPHASGKADGSLVEDWRIHFRPQPELLLKGTNPLCLLRELREMGTLQIAVDTTMIPSLDEMDVEKCYVGWDMVLSTRVNCDSIRDVFIFVQDESELTIEPVSGTAKPLPTAVETVERTVPPANSASSSNIRVSVDKLDQLVNLVGELVTV